MFPFIELDEKTEKSNIDLLSEYCLAMNSKITTRGSDISTGPLGNNKVQFQYNATYPGPPTLESEYAWLDLLPGE
jgi:hypothetical protein